MNKHVYLNKKFIILFTIGLLIKLYIIFTHSPEIINNLFAPFINQFLSNPTQNPYDYFLFKNRLDIFPYGSLMMIFLGWIQGLWYLITYSLAETSPILLSLLIFDFALFVLLLKRLKRYQNYVLLLYWLSPLVFYITYIHGQLDIIPTFFLILSFYFLDSRLGLVALFLGLSIAIKMNNLLVAPFFALYLYKNHTTVPNLIKYAIYLIVPYFIFNGALVFSEGFQQIVLFNQVQKNLLNIFFSIGPVQIYLVPILYGMLLIRFYLFPFIVRDLFMLFVTITFGVITIFLIPQPGWYLWIIPLLIYVIIQYDKILILPYYLWSILLVIYFIYPDNFIYTAIVFIQLILLVYIYFQIIKKYTKTKILYHPYFIGIAGDSGTGKTQLSQSIYDFFGNKFSIVFCGDDLHKWERGDENWEQYTHLNPIAQNLYNNIKDFIRLKQGKKIQRTHYDHGTGKFRIINNLVSKNIIVHEGLHSLYLPHERSFYDLKIFMDPQKELYLEWKIQRDMLKRGYSREKVIENISKRLADKEKYIDIQRQHADIIISFYVNEKGYNQQGVKIYSDMLLDISSLQLELSTIGICEATVEIHNFQQVLNVCLSKEISYQQWHDSLQKLCPEIYNYPFINNFTKDNYDGFILLYIIYYIFRKEGTNEKNNYK